MELSGVGGRAEIWECRVSENSTNRFSSDSEENRFVEFSELELVEQ